MATSTLYMDNNTTVKQIDLTDLRLHTGVSEMACVSINNKNVLTFENTHHTKSLIIYDLNGTLILFNLLMKQSLMKM